MLEKLPSKTIILGVLNLGDMRVETPERSPTASARAAAIAPERLVLAPDCGMKYLPREIAFGKMKAIVDGAAIVRAELSA